MIRVNKEQKEAMVSAIQEYFEVERGEELGMIGAEQIYIDLSEIIGPYFYNQGVRDAKEMVEQKLMNMDEDILSLEKQTSLGYRR